MRYTYKKICGALFLLLGIMVVSRIAPDWLFYGTMAVIGIVILYLMYFYSRY